MVFSIVNQQTLVSAANLSSFSLLSPSRAKISTSSTSSVSCPSFPSQVRHHIVKRLSCKAASEKSDPNPDNHPKSKRKGKTQSKPSKEPENENAGEKPFPGIIPKKPRRGRRSEAAAVEDYVRNTLERTLDSIRKQNPEAQNMQSFMKEKASSDGDTSDDEDEDEDESNTSEGAKKMVVEEEDPDWPLDTEVGWGIRASEYFDQHPIKNVVGEDGTKIDWEGEIDYGLVKEINCLEWESFAFHPSPLVVLVFERYKRASDNWRALKELEKAAEVYWKAKDRLPPRTVKIDINIEKDLAYALKVREGPQILFLRGNKILYRERDVRSADEFVEMIAYFYYNARKPSYINDADLFSPP